MTTRYGYISNPDAIYDMPQKDLEATIIDLDRDRYINEWERRDLLNDYMSARWGIMQKQFEYTDENVRLLNEANELLKASAERVARKAWRVFQAEKESLQAYPCKTFYYVMVEAHLHVPYSFGMDKDGQPLVVGDVDETLWDALTSFYRLERSGGILLPGSLYSYGESYKSEDDFVCQVLWSLPYDEDPKARNWGYDCLMDMEATKDICFAWPFHSLVSHEHMALSNLIKIRGYKESITVEYGRMDDKRISEKS